MKRRRLKCPLIEFCSNNMVDTVCIGERGVVCKTSKVIHPNANNGYAQVVGLEEFLFYCFSVFHQFSALSKICNFFKM